MVDAAVDADRVLDVAVDRAAAQAGRAGATLGAIKRELYGAALAKLEAAAA